MVEKYTGTLSLFFIIKLYKLKDFNLVHMVKIQNIKLSFV